MTVYVDDMRIAYGHMRMSHLLADSSAELAAFAAELGLKPDWLQQAGTAYEHYDVSDSKRRAALELGARPITLRQTGELMKRKAEALKITDRATPKV